MNERDVVDDLLAGHTVPAMRAALADRIVAEAQRAGRRRSPAPARRRVRRWTRRGAWTAAIALNLIVASAVAAAIGGAGFMPPVVVAAAHSVMAKIHAHVPSLRRNHGHVPSLRYNVAPRVAALHRAPAPFVSSSLFHHPPPSAVRFASPGGTYPRPALARRFGPRGLHPMVRKPDHRAMRGALRHAGPRHTRVTKLPRHASAAHWRGRNDAFQTRHFGPVRDPYTMGRPPRWRMPQWRRDDGRAWNRGGRWGGPRFGGGGRRGRRW